MGPRRGISDQHHIEVNILDTSMSAIGTKRTSLVALHMSAFGGKADMRPRSRSSPPDKRDVFHSGCCRADGVARAGAGAVGGVSEDGRFWGKGEQMELRLPTNTRPPAII
jgi:hypothetical protein